jgi:hypothetical protein
MAAGAIETVAERRIELARGKDGVYRGQKKHSVEVTSSSNERVRGVDFAFGHDGKWDSNESQNYSAKANP